jgi:N-methylhydantoinase A
MERPATTEITTGGRSVAARVADAALLATGETLAGPAMIEGYSSTIWLPPGWVAARDQAGNLMLRKEA